MFACVQLIGLIYSSRALFTRKNLSIKIAGERVAVSYIVSKMDLNGLHVLIRRDTPFPIILFSCLG